MSIREVFRAALFPSAARTVSEAGAPFTVDQDHVVCYLDVTAASGAGPTLNVDIEAYDDASGQWFVVGSFAQLTSVGRERLSLGVVPDNTLRANAAIGGTGPSFTFSCNMIAKDA